MGMQFGAHLRSHWSAVTCISAELGAVTIIYLQLSARLSLDVSTVVPAVGRAVTLSWVRLYAQLRAVTPRCACS